MGAKNDLFLVRREVSPVEQGAEEDGRNGQRGGSPPDVRLLF